MAGNKRKRGQATNEPEEAIDIDENAENDQIEKERRVWEAFRDEHYEAIEQLPLTLQRQYTLLEDLDRQITGHTTGLLSVIDEYIRTRHKLQECARQTTFNDDLQDGEPVALDADVQQSTSAPIRCPTDPMSSLQSTRTLLSELATLTDGYIRVSEEKLNVAEAAYNSVDRQVRIIEQAIGEQQQAMLKAGVSPEDEIMAVSPPTWNPPVPNPYEISNGNHGHTDPEPTQPENATRSRKRKGKPRAPPPTRPDHATEGGPKVKLLLRPPAKEHEETYCFCHQGSFGEMVACDNQTCPYEWFHIDCLPSKELPPDGVPWFCPECLLDIQLHGERTVPRRRRK